MYQHSPVSAFIMGSNLALAISPKKQVEITFTGYF